MLKNLASIPIRVLVTGSRGKSSLVRLLHAGLASLGVRSWGRVTGVLPKPDHPVSQGMLCSKGWQGHGFVRHPDRLDQPLIRHEDGTLRPASWNEAYRAIAEQFRSLTRVHGPDCFATLSSARCTNEENYLVAKLTRAVIGSPNIDHCARL